jgi:anaerobic selenocysteine-containing dehydrogenase
VEYRSLNPDGKGVLKAATYRPAHERPSEEFPLQLITGRTVYHFHTRTKTGRAPELQDAAPDVWVEVSSEDATRNGWQDGDLLCITTPRGEVLAPARIGGIRPGVVFLPFHYGYWDTEAGCEPAGEQPGRAANELTVTDWDPASKQPIYKTAACAIRPAVEPAETATGEGSAP